MSHRLFATAALGVAVLAGAPAPAQEAGLEGRRAGTILGLDAHGPDGRPIGEVADLQVADDARVMYIVIDDELGVEGDLAVPWAHAVVTAETVQVPNLDAAVRAFGAPGPQGWSFAELRGATVQAEGDPEWGELRDVVIAPRGSVEQFVVTAAGGETYLVPAAGVMVGPDAEYAKLTLDADRLGALPLYPRGEVAESLKPLSETPDKAAIAPRERIEAQLADDVRDWQRRVMRFAHLAMTTPERMDEAEQLTRDFKTMQQMWQGLRQTRDDNFETMVEKFDAAREQLAETWEEVGGPALAGIE